MAEKYPTLEIELGKPVELKLNFDSPKSGEGDYGTWYLYSVSIGEEKFIWFPPTVIHETIQTLGLKRGSKFTVIKQAIEIDGKLRKKHVLIHDEHIYDPETATGDPGQAELPKPNETPKPIEPSPILSLTEDERRHNLANRLFECLNDAHKIVAKFNEKHDNLPLGPSEVERIGVSIFIELNRGG